MLDVHVPNLHQAGFPSIWKRICGWLGMHARFRELQRVDVALAIQILALKVPANQHAAIIKIHIRAPNVSA